jgi:ABC-type uncharacterized transport system permease subunit
MILCFAISYAVSVVMEAVRIFLRNDLTRTVALTAALICAGIGLAVHTFFLHQQHIAAANRIGGAEMYFFASAWGLVWVYLYLACFRPKIPFGLVLLPIILLLIGGGAFVAAVPDIKVEHTINIVSAVKMFHAGTFSLTTLAISIGCVAGLLYLIQDDRLRHKRIHAAAFQLPTLEWSLAVCRQAMGVSVFSLGACIFSGLIIEPPFNKINEQVTIGDPLVIGSIFMFGFLLIFSGLLSFRFCKTEGRRVAVLTLVMFLFLVFVLVFGLVQKNAHWKRSQQLGVHCQKISRSTIHDPLSTN